MNEHDANKPSRPSSFVAAGGLPSFLDMTGRNGEEKDAAGDRLTNPREDGTPISGRRGQPTESGGEGFGEGGGWRGKRSKLARRA